MSVTLKARSQTLRGAPARFRLDIHRELVPGVHTELVGIRRSDVSAPRTIVAGHGIAVGVSFGRRGIAGRRAAMGPLGIGWAPMSRHRDHTLPASVTHWADVDPSLQFAIGAVCRLNKTLPLSPGVSTQLDFDARYVQRTVRLDIVGMETLCSRWVNAPLDHPLRFELRPFSRQLEQAWAHAVTLMPTYARMNITLPEPAAASFDEFLLSLVLQQHQHNYSEDLFRQSGATTPRIVREAEHWMRTGGPEASVSKIAARVGMSLRSLEAGFREWNLIRRVGLPSQGCAGSPRGAKTEISRAGPSSALANPRPGVPLAPSGIRHGQRSSLSQRLVP
jgi:hypothetical protein